MKKQILILTFLFYCLSSNSQVVKDEYVTSKKSGVDCKNLYFGLTAGVNSNGVVAAQIEYLTESKVGFNVNVGLGTWGIKSSVGMNIYFSKRNSNCGLGWSLGASFHNSSGFRYDIESTLDVYNEFGIEETEIVTLRYLPTQSFDIRGSYYWRLGSKARFQVSLGYELLLTNPYYKVMSNHKLTETSKSIMNFIAPGGNLMAFGFVF